MVKFFLNLKITVLSMFMISTVIFKDQNSILLVLELMIFKLYQLPLDTLSLSGPKIRTTQLEKVTTESTHSSTLEFIKAKIENSFQFLITKFRM